MVPFKNKIKLKILLDFYHIQLKIHEQVNLINVKMFEINLPNMRYVPVFRIS